MSDRLRFNVTDRFSFGSDVITFPMLRFLLQVVAKSYSVTLLSADQVQSHEIDDLLKKLKENISMSKVNIVMELELKLGVTGADFETFTMNEFNPVWEEIPGLKATLLKGNEGSRAGKYLSINTYESAERRHELFPNWGEPGEEVQRWISANQGLWDRFFSMCEITDHTDYVEV